MRYVTYFLLHMEELFNFYDFTSTRNRWLNYLSKQKAAEFATHILINGEKKYNKNRRNKSKTNKKQEKKKKVKKTENK